MVKLDGSCGLRRPRWEARMVRLLAHWILSALCLLLVSRFVPGFIVSGFGTALIAAVVIGLVNGTLGLLLKLISIPLILITFRSVLAGHQRAHAGVRVPAGAWIRCSRIWARLFGERLILSLLNFAIRAIL